MIKRQLLANLIEASKSGKTIILLGARQVGKTTLFKQFLESTNCDSSLWLNCDQNETIRALSTTNLQELKLLIGGASHIVIDEAQRVPNIGLTIKVIVDNIPNVSVLVTGSSALELKNLTSESLTGRKRTFYLYPFATQELYEAMGLISVKESLNKRLIYGSYPEVFLDNNNPLPTLLELADSYLYKDLLEFEGIRKSSILQKLLVALALQVGSEVSYNELSKTVGISSKTIERYLDILEKCYIVFRLPSFSRNMRNELSKSKKIYFYDNGIRNAIIGNFAPVETRQDMGALWENFFIAERIKYNHYNSRVVNHYFWRTKDKQKIDFIEESNGELSLFEMKWNVNKRNPRLPNAFISTYNPKEMSVVTPENYLPFLITL